MPIVFAVVSIPAQPTTIAEARPYLLEFVDWVEDFFESVAEAYVDAPSDPPIFVPELIGNLRPALREAREAGLFARVREVLGTIGDEHIALHGLYGFQLQWKLSNVWHWCERFIEIPGRHLFERLLDAIDAILESILSTIPGGGGIVEIKEAIRNSVDILDGEYS